MATKAEALQLITTLQGLMPHLPQKDHAFATGLMDSTMQHGPTEGRVKWLNELIQRAQDSAAHPAADTPATTNVGSFAKVMALFNLAKENLQRPKIRLQLREGQPLVLAMAGNNSQHPGTVNVTDDGGYGHNKWYGRVTMDGEWTKTKKLLPELDEVEGLLKKLGEAPAQVAAEYGRLTGRCCFCNLKLSDERSTAAGFGRTCASNYGLLDEWKESDAFLKTREAQEI